MRISVRSRTSPSTLWFSPPPKAATSGRYYSLVLPACDGAYARRLLEVLGEVKRNPHFVGGSSE